MKTSWLLQALCFWLLVPIFASAQPAQPAGPPYRRDLHAAVGWASVSADEFAPLDDWDNTVAQGIVGIGWYWSDHLKTEIDVRLAGDAEFRHFEQAWVAGRGTYRSSTFRVGTSSVSLGQQYQFFRNAWVHPYLGAGVELQRHSLKEDVEPVMAYDEGRRQYVEVDAGRSIGPLVSWAARPFVLVGVKAYVSRRAFFRTDARVVFGTNPEQVVVSAGFGVDF